MLHRDVDMEVDYVTMAAHKLDKITGEGMPAVRGVTAGRRFARPVVFCLHPFDLPSCSTASHVQ